MTKTKTVIISILLMTSAIIIKILSKSQLDNEWIGFFSGIVLGAGVAIFLQTIIKKKVEKV